MDTAIVLFTRDLRVRDNPALSGACARARRMALEVTPGHQVVPAGDLSPGGAASAFWRWRGWLASSRLPTGVERGRELGADAHHDKRARVRQIKNQPEELPEGLIRVHTASRLAAQPDRRPHPGPPKPAAAPARRPVSGRPPWATRT